MAATNYDDLTAIKGIGQARQQWLRTALNIRTFGDLAACSIDTIETRLKADNLIAARNEIKEWIAEARKRAADLPDVQISGPQPISPTREDGWKPFASFVVEFQTHHTGGQAAQYRTTVHYMEADKNEIWSGIQNEPLCRWMLDHLPPQEAVKEEPITKPSEAALSIEITQIEIAQPNKSLIQVHSDQLQQAFAGYIGSDETFSLSASLECAGLEKSESHGPITCSAQFQAYNLTTGAKIELGDTEPGELVGTQTQYTATLPQASLQPGTYRLRVIARLQGESSTLNYLEMPLLQVV